MRYWAVLGGIILLALAVAAMLAGWRERQEIQAAARNFTQVLDQIKHSETRPLRASNPSSARPSRGFAALLNAIAVQAQNFAAESQALERKFEAIDLGNVLSASNLTSADGIARSRAKVKAMRALILERKRMLRAYLDRMEAMLRDAAVADDEKLRALQSFEETKPRTIDAYAALEDAQKSVIAKTSAILDLARQNIGSTAARNGQLQFKSRAQLDRYNLLLEQLADAATAEKTAMQNMAAMQLQAKREAEQALAKLAN